MSDCFIFSYDKVESVDSGVVTLIYLLYTVYSRDLFFIHSGNLCLLIGDLVHLYFFVTILLGLSLPSCFLFVYPFFSSSFPVLD